MLNYLRNGCVKNLLSYLVWIGIYSNPISLIGIVVCGVAMHFYEHDICPENCIKQTCQYISCEYGNCNAFKVECTCPTIFQSGTTEPVCKKTIPDMNLHPFRELSIASDIFAFSVLGSILIIFFAVQVYSYIFDESISLHWTRNNRQRRIRSAANNHNYAMLNQLNNINYDDNGEINNYNASDEIEFIPTSRTNSSSTSVYIQDA